jgi:hypothetical protein
VFGQAIIVKTFQIIHGGPAALRWQKNPDIMCRGYKVYRDESKSPSLAADAPSAIPNKSRSASVDTRSSVACRLLNNRRKVMKLRV